MTMRISTICLHERVRKHSLGEMRHAEKVIERIFFEGVPNVQRLGKINLDRACATPAMSF
jgi:bacterioferritin (cytochrome b1)